MDSSLDKDFASILLVTSGGVSHVKKNSREGGPKRTPCARDPPLSFSVSPVLNTENRAFVWIANC